MRTRSPWYWVPSLYFAEGLPYVAVMILSLVMYKRMGISNTEVALYTSWLNLPWVIKPLWSPFVDLLRTKRWWIVTTQLLLGAGLAGIAFTIPTSHFFQTTLAVFWLVAFSSATHDIAADGFYMLGLTPASASLLRGHPQHVLPLCHHRRTRTAHYAGRLAGRNDRTHIVRLEHHLLHVSRLPAGSVAIPFLRTAPS